MGMPGIADFLYTEFLGLGGLSIFKRMEGALLAFQKANAGNNGFNNNNNNGFYNNNNNNGFNYNNGFGSYNNNNNGGNFGRKTQPKIVTGKLL